jgi:hypothetical protein
MRDLRLHRRTLLRGAGGAVLGLPWLEAMLPRRARAGGAAAPLRLIVFFSNDGTYHPNYYPTGTEHEFVLSPILAPLAPFQDRLIVTRGIDMEVSYHGYNPGEPHPWIASILTGALMLEGDPGQPIGGGISLDHWLGQQIGGATKFPTFEFGVQAQQFVGYAEQHLSYAGPAQPISREDDPHAVFDTLFSDLDAEPAELAARRARRQLVVDAVQDDLARLRPRLGSEDRVRIDRHVDAVDELERRIQDELGGVGTACQLPSIGDPLAGGSLYSNAIYPALGKATMDMLVMALACDMTRITTLQWNTALGSPG